MRHYHLVYGHVRDFFFTFRAAILTLVGNHKALEVLLNGHGNVSPQIECWQLRPQSYNPRVVYQPGIQNAMEIRSRKPVPEGPPR